MSDLGYGQKPYIQPHYPHFLAEDTAVWTRFLQTDAHRIARCWYDVKVGRPMDLPASASDVEIKVAAGVSRKRIDVVCLVDSSYWIIEIKPFGNMVALGQVLTYSRLFPLEYDVTGEIVPVIVCAGVDEDLIDEFEELGILVLVTE